MTARLLTLARAAIPLVIVLIACYPRRVESVRPLVMQLRSPTPVLLNQSRPDGTIVTSMCETLTADVQVEQLRGDTLFYAQLSNRRSSRTEETCGTVGPGFIVLTAHPNISSTVATKSKALTLFAVPLIALVGVGILFTPLLVSGILFR
ncbi:MAG: hypothetical protein IT353_09095 [Gemmatimonadaceae bacterium]|nr:hypothetical protein [Gemmatimonadaceae bacterium]